MIRIPAITLLGLFLLGAGCERHPLITPSPTTTTAEPEIDWTPERIAAEPDRYLQFAERRIQEQVAVRQTKLADLRRRRSEIEAKSADLLRSVSEAQNLDQRLTQAMQRAEDEDRWPLVFAGRKFSQQKAADLQAAIAAYGSKREPLAAAYRDALQRVDRAETSLQADITSLGEVREQLALDLERVRLNQGMAEIAELRRTEAKLANFSGALVDLTDDSLGTLTDSTAEKELSLEDLLNQ